MPSHPRCRVASKAHRTVPLRTSRTPHAADALGPGSRSAPSPPAAPRSRPPSSRAPPGAHRLCARRASREGGGGRRRRQLIPHELDGARWPPRGGRVREIESHPAGHDLRVPEHLPHVLRRVTEGSRCRQQQASRGKSRWISPVSLGFSPPRFSMPITCLSPVSHQGGPQGKKSPRGTIIHERSRGRSLLPGHGTCFTSKGGGL